MNHIDPPELTRVFSDYLCTECKGLLYLDLDAKDEVCINPKCVLFNKGTVFGDPNSENLSREIGEEKRKLLLSFMRTDRSRFTRYVYEERRNLIRNLFYGGTMNGVRFFGLNELLIELNNKKPVGRQTAPAVFSKIVEDYGKLVDEMNFIDDLGNQRYLIAVAPEKHTLVLKYFKVFLDFYRNYGIVNRAEIASSGLFKYREIEAKAKEAGPQTTKDLGEYFARMFDFIISLKYFLSRHYRTSLQFRYTAHLIDGAAMMGLVYSLDDSTQSWSNGGLQQHFDKHSNGARSFKAFEVQYITSTTKAPVIVRDGDSNLVDRDTLLFFLFHVIGIATENLPAEARKVSTVKEKKEIASTVFEDKIRFLMKAHGFEGPDSGVEVGEKGESFEFDALGVNSKKKVILMVEAKYKDFAPSSISGKTLLSQELLLKEDDKGLLWTAVRQQLRHEFFCRNPSRFAGHLKQELNLREFTVEPLVVTKYVPLISKYRDVSLLDYDSFVRKLEKDFPAET